MASADGPWWIEENEDKGMVLSNCWGPLAAVPEDMYAHAPDKTMRRDTARLMAAAPQLLAMLTEAADWLGHVSNCTASDDCLKASRDLIDHLNGDK